jgi:hypothetical protein
VHDLMVTATLRKKCLMTWGWQASVQSRVFVPSLLSAGLQKAARSSHLMDDIMNII